MPRSKVEEAVCTMPAAAKVISLDPSSLREVLEDIRRLGEATGRAEKAAEVAVSLERRVQQVRERASLARYRPRVFCAEWLDPIFCAGHWLPEMVALAGGEEALGSPFADSIRIDWERVRGYDPEVVILMPCGFDALAAIAEARWMTERPGWKNLTAVRAGRVYIVDANSYFARPGPRLVDGLEILAHLIQPELSPAPQSAGFAYKLADGSLDHFAPLPPI